MQLSVNIKNLTKSFNKPSLLFRNSKKTVCALKDVSLKCPSNKITCLLGPNGAGKTTLIKILSGLIIQDSGDIEYNEDDQSVLNKKIKIGLMTPNERSFYWRLTGRQNLDFFAELHNYKHKEKKEIINSLLEEFDLAKDADKELRFYSTGMKSKMLIIRAMLGDPDVIILDEPTSHIDPIARENIHSIIKDKIISQKKKTVILCTHDLEEAKSLSDHLVLLNEGRVIAEGDYNKLEKRINPNIVFKIGFLKMPDKKFFKMYENFSVEDKTAEFVLIDEKSIPELIKKAVDNNGEILWCREQKEDLLVVFKRFMSGTEAK